VSETELLIDPDRLLGTGGYARVFVGKYQHADVAIKIADSSKTLFSEMRMLRRVRHPNLVSFYGACLVREDYWCIVEELIHGSTLQQVIDAPEALSPQDRRAILCGICSAVIHLHSHKPAVVHGDLKPKNILIEPNGNKVKVVDLGLSCLQKSKSSFHGCTWRWASPETLDVQEPRQSPTPAADIYSLGLLAFFVVTFCKPFEGIDKDELKEHAKQCRIPELHWPNPHLPLQLECQDLCRSCLSPNPADRPTAEASQESFLRWNADNPKTAL